MVTNDLYLQGNLSFTKKESYTSFSKSEHVSHRQCHVETTRSCSLPWALHTLEKDGIEVVKWEC